MQQQGLQRHYKEASGVELYALKGAFSVRFTRLVHVTTAHCLVACVLHASVGMMYCKELFRMQIVAFCMDAATAMLCAQAMPHQATWLLIKQNLAHAADASDFGAPQTRHCVCTGRKILQPH